MLNIGRLAATAADYYLAEVATTPDAYYTGTGEAPGRWMGTLAADLGLRGQVDPDAFRAVLDGRHPTTGEQLARHRCTRPGPPSNPHAATLFDDDTLELPQVAARLGIGVRHVRKLIWAGERPGAAPERHLRATRRPLQPGERGRPRWVVPRVEVERLAATGRRSQTRPGYDLTFRPPKSVSVLWALASDDVQSAVRDAHDEAVQAAVDYLEAHAVTARQSDAARTPIETDGLICAAFDHRTSRAGDPLLHTHVVAANLTKTVTGRWQALDARPLYDHARPTGILYQAHLRHALTTRLGVHWEPVTNGYAEVTGIPTPVLKAFSKRRNEIEDLVAEAGYTSAHAHQAATLATRHAKTHTEPATLLERWRAEAAELGFGPDQLARCLGQAVPALTRPDLDRLTAELAGPRGLTERAATFRRRDLMAAVAERAPGGATGGEVQAVTDRLLGSGAFCAVTTETGWLQRRTGDRRRDPDRTLWSTPELLRLEADLLGWAAGGLPRAAGQPRPPLVTGLPRVEDCSGHWRVPLSAEQERMVTALLQKPPASIATVAGRPGAGKTTALARYVDAVTAGGRPVVGCALAAAAAGELEAACGFEAMTGRPATTIARLLVDLGQRDLPAGAVVIVDEASMVGTRDLHRLAVHTARASGMLVLVGDPDQHGSVDVGGLFRHLTAQPTAALTANHRQRHEGDRAAIEAFRSEDVVGALDIYLDGGVVVRAPTAEACLEQLVTDWWDTTSVTGVEDPMIAGTNAVRRHLNGLARDRMRDAGLLTGPTLEANVPLTAGDRVVARRNDRHLTSADGGYVKNGSAGTVTAVDLTTRTVTVRFDVEGTITIPARYLDAGHLDHAYARTTYGVQGATLSHAFVYVDDRTHFEEAYVALTRGREATRIYLVDGSVATDPETGSRAHDTARTGLDTVTDAMSLRRSSRLAHDDEPRAGAAAALAHLDLAQLRAERVRLRSVLDQAPSDVTDRLQAVDDALAVLAARLRANPASPRQALALRHIERLTEERRQLGGQSAVRAAFLADHASELEALATVRAAEAAREALVRERAIAAPDRAVVARLGPRPASPISRRAWDDAVTLTAAYLERHPPDRLGSAGDPLLGDRPQGIEARIAYAQARHALEAFADVAAPQLDAASRPLRAEVIDLALL